MDFEEYKKQVLGALIAKNHKPAEANLICEIFAVHIETGLANNKSPQEVGHHLSFLMINHEITPIDITLKRLMEIKRLLRQNQPVTLTISDEAVISDACQHINAVRLLMLSSGEKQI